MYCILYNIYEYDQCCPVPIKSDGPLIHFRGWFGSTHWLGWPEPVTERFSGDRNKASSATSARSTRSWAWQPIARPFLVLSVVRIEDGIFVIWKKAEKRARFPQFRQFGLEFCPTPPLASAVYHGRPCTCCTMMRSSGCLPQPAQLGQNIWCIIIIFDICILWFPYLIENILCILWFPYLINNIWYILRVLSFGA